MKQESENTGGTTVGVILLILVLVIIVFEVRVTRLERRMDAVEQKIK